MRNVKWARLLASYVTRVSARSRLESQPTLMIVKRNPALDISEIEKVEIVFKD